jgi:nucleotide-binding universal stress UspA family protein
MVRPIVAVTDGSELSRLAPARAGRSARASGQRVVVVFVRHSQLSGATNVFASEAILTLQYEFDAVQAAAFAYSISELDPLGVVWSFEARSGEPIQQIMDAAQFHQSDTIVIATDHRGLLGTKLRLSRSARLAHKWPGTPMVVE